MNQKQVKNELQNILSGKNGGSYDALIQTIANHLRSGTPTGPMDKTKRQNKAEETKKLIQFASGHSLFIKHIDEEKFISHGAEQKVYIKNGQYVIKLNDSIYYASWQDYFLNLLLNNYFFADTAYRLLGFHIKEDVLYAVVQQSFVRANKITDLSKVKELLGNNGFENIKNNDYYHPYLGIILEDLHDENVLTQN